MSQSLTAAMAFGISAAVTLLAQGALFVMGWRLRPVFEEIIAEARAAEVIDPEKGLTSGLKPESQLVVVAWAVDASSILAGLVGPIAGLVLLRHHISEGLAWLLGVAAILVVVSFLFFVGLSKPRSYHSAPIRFSVRGRDVHPVGPISPIALFVLAVTGGCGAAAAFLG
jgi:hypothetical protein